MVVRSIEMHEDMTNIRIDALLLCWLMSASLGASVRAVVESILVGLDVIPWVIPGIVLGTFNRFILGRSGHRTVWTPFRGRSDWSWLVMSNRCSAPRLVLILSEAVDGST